MRIIRFICFMVSCLLSMPALSDDLTLNIDKKVISEGDVLHLTISYDGSSNENPDFSSILGDFQVISNSSSRQYSMINGVVNQIKKWTIGLKPLKTGKITIKPVKLDGLTSNYAEVEVKELSNVAYIPDSDENYNSPYFQIEQSIEDKSLYLNQQGILWVTIYDSIGLNNGRLNIDDQSKSNWLVLPILNKPIIKQETIKGKKMNVATFGFAVFPQKSGEIALPLFTFEGDYIKDVDFGFSNLENQFGLFGGQIQGMFGSTVPVRMKTKDKKITVKPAINNNYQYWLVAKDVKIDGKSSLNKDITVGDAFSYEVKIKATGVPQSLFPVIKMNSSEGLKQYVEKPEYSEEIKGKDIITTATYNIVYIPEKSGEMILPSVDVYWFNTQTNSFEKASTNKQTINITPRTEGAKQDVKKENTLPDMNNTIKQEQAYNPSSAEKIFKFIVDFKKAHFIELLGALVVALLLILYKINTQKPINIYTKSVIKSIKLRDYKQAKNLLIEWAKIKFGKSEINNFRDIALCAKNYEFEKQLDILNKLLYSNCEEFLNVADFIKTFKDVNKQKIKRRNDQDVLPTLYK